MVKPQEAIERIVYYRGLIGANRHDPEGLSKVVEWLSYHNHMLAVEEAQLHKKASDKAYMVFTEALAAGEGVTKAEMLSRGESTQERYEYENVKNIYRATSNLITSLQTKIRVLGENNG